MIVDISVAVIALAFVILVIYLITIIKALHITLGQVNQTLVESRRQLNEVGGQAQKVMEHTNQISFDLKQKVEALNPIFNSVANLGEVLEHKTFSFKKESFASTHEEDHLSNLGNEKKKSFQAQGLTTIAAILELASMSMRLWQKNKQRR